MGMIDPLRERALKLLARREYARAELLRKLMPYAQSKEEVECLLGDLAARQILSDERYAKARVNARGRRFGNAVLTQELRSAGVPESYVKNALADCSDELTRARQVWQRKFGDKALKMEASEYNRQKRFLLGRGFSGETIHQVLNMNFEEDLSDA